MVILHDAVKHDLIFFSFATWWHEGQSSFVSLRRAVEIIKSVKVKNLK